MKWIRYAQLTIGSSSREQVDAYRLDAPISHYPEMEGIAGLAALGFNVVQFDWERGQMSWMK